MIGLGGVTTALALLGIWLTRRGRLPGNRWFWRAFIWTTPLAILANSFGWIFTEMGRQPWAVFGEMLTRDALSPSVPGWQVITLPRRVRGPVPRHRHHRAAPPDSVRASWTAAGRPGSEPGSRNADTATDLRLLGPPRDIA